MIESRSWNWLVLLPEFLDPAFECKLCVAIVALDGIILGGTDRVRLVIQAAHGIVDFLLRGEIDSRIFKHKAIEVVIYEYLDNLCV